MESEPPTSSLAPPTASESSKTLFTSLYRELRLLAERQLRRNQGAAISPTTLLHEAYLNMSAGSAQFPDQERFMGYASRVMRGLIIDLVRERRAKKRGSEFHITQLPLELAEVVPDERELVRLSDAIDELSVRDARLAGIVDLKYFCGYSFVEIAAFYGTSERTVQRDWEKARTLLYQSLQETG